MVLRQKDTNLSLIRHTGHLKAPSTSAAGFTNLVGWRLNDVTKQKAILLINSGDPNNSENSSYVARIEIFGTDYLTDSVAKLPKSQLANPAQRAAFEELFCRRDRAIYK